jgi:CO/xanthine dehydrogenase FAD-binding subunit
MSLRYVSPASLSEALSFLAEHGPDSIILAGGMSLVPTLKKGLLTQKFIVNIKRIGEMPLPTFDSTDGHLTISALVRHREIETSPIIAEHFPALCALEERLGSVQIRNHGTLAGNLCAAEPWTDPPCLLAALDARLTVVSKRGQRQVCTEVGSAALAIRCGSLTSCCIGSIFSSRTEMLASVTPEWQQDRD